MAGAPVCGSRALPDLAGTISIPSHRMCPRPRVLFVSQAKHNQISADHIFRSKSSARVGWHRGPRRRQRMVPMRATGENREDLAWLLQPSNPSVRYLSRRALLERLGDHAEGQRARGASMQAGPRAVSIERRSQASANLHARSGFHGICPRIGGVPLLSGACLHVVLSASAYLCLSRNRARVQVSWDRSKKVGRPQ
jgi:hypothetical protein